MVKLRSSGDTVRVREGYTWCKYSAYVGNSQKLTYRVKLKEMEHNGFKQISIDRCLLIKPSCYCPFSVLRENLFLF